MWPWACGAAGGATAALQARTGSRADLDWGRGQGRVRGGLSASCGMWPPGSAEGPGPPVRYEHVAPQRLAASYSLARVLQGPVTSSESFNAGGGLMGAQACRCLGGRDVVRYMLLWGQETRFGGRLAGSGRLKTLRGFPLLRDGPAGLRYGCVSGVFSGHAAGPECLCPGYLTFFCGGWGAVRQACAWSWCVLLSQVAGYAPCFGQPL